MGKIRLRPWMSSCIMTASLVALSACGGGSDGNGTSSIASVFGFGASDNMVALPVSTHPSASEAGRFLTQATFGPTQTTISDLSLSTYNDWITAQLALPQKMHLADIDARLAARRLTDRNANLDDNDFYNGFWDQAVNGNDQLRQRVAFALSEIFVTSFTNPNVDPRGMADYYDMLSRDAFGNYRDLIQDVTLHPMMGLYLNALGNQKEDPDTGRHPDENYAREIMQLMSVGLYELNPDGTRKLDLFGNPQATYTQEDIQGLAKVFTGFSWYSSHPNDGSFYGWDREEDASIRPMIPYNSFHSTSEKAFLGVTIPANPTPNAKADLKIALDKIFNHPNVGPFICKQLIQRLVTSNPSPGYVRRVSAIFSNNGAGVRGDLKAVVRAILTDTEARSATSAASPTFGKLREPVVRAAHVMRAFKATSQTGDWRIGSTDDWLKQSPLTSPSVFNFWRPGYVPPNTQLGAGGYLAPEFQGVNEITVSSYVNGAQDLVSYGIGDWVNNSVGRDVHLSMTGNFDAVNVPNLINYMNLVLLNGQMSPSLRGHLQTAITSIDISSTDKNVRLEAYKNRIRTAILLTVVSPEYIAQR